MAGCSDSPTFTNDIQSDEDPNDFYIEVLQIDSLNNPFYTLPELTGSMNNEKLSGDPGTDSFQSSTGYPLQLLGTLGGSQSFAMAINNNGQVTGYSQISSGQMHAYMWDENSGMVALGTLGGGESRGFDINDNGQIVGHSSTFSRVNHAFLWDKDSGMIDLGTLGGTHSFALSINNNGQVTGYSQTSSRLWHTFLWDEDTGMVDLGTLGGIRSWGDAINDNGQVAGYSFNKSGQIQTFLWDENTGMVDLGTLGGARSRGYAINKNGQVTGHSLTPSAEDHAFLWDENTGMADLGSLGGSSQGFAINDHGQVAGRSSTSSGQTRAFFWDETSGMEDLGAFNGPSVARGINNNEQIAGHIENSSGNWEAAIWTIASNNPPVADAGSDRTLECTGDSTFVTLNGSGSSDPDGDSLTYSWSFGGTEIATGDSPDVNLPLGSHTITLTVTDPDGESDSDEVVINIVDTTPPVLDYTVETTTLWPPDRRMVLALSGISATDLCDPGPSLVVMVNANDLSANGNSFGNGVGNGLGNGFAYGLDNTASGSEKGAGIATTGNRRGDVDEIRGAGIGGSSTDSDWIIENNGDGTVDVYLRAEIGGRGIGNGRTYTVSITSTDASGNIAEETIDVKVKNNRGR